MAAESIRVEICYATPEVQAMVALTVAAGTTARQALERSGLAQRFPDIKVDSAVLGIRGKRVEHGRVLEAGDRLEVLRPLTADPKETRRRLAAKGKTMGKTMGKTRG
jgi:putative ubiquitin-RnfH superfamily antitoxin RatB of RatAB toxin-antitoxin module